MSPHAGGPLRRRVVLTNGGGPRDKRLHGPHSTRMERQDRTVPEGPRWSHIDREVYAFASE